MRKGSWAEQFKQGLGSDDDVFEDELHQIAAHQNAFGFAGAIFRVDPIAG